MKRLYFADLRCNGYTEQPTFRYEKPDPAKKCKKADACERFLQQVGGPTTPRQDAPSTSGCELYIERARASSEE